jgi:hypothetical protein
MRTSSMAVKLEPVRMRYIPEKSGGLLDTKTGLREWFTSYGEAIRIATMRNARSLLT